MPKKTYPGAAKIGSLLLFCSVMLFGCQNSQPSGTMTATTPPVFPQQSVGKKNSEIINLENPQIGRLTSDALWQDTPTIYENWAAWSELQYVGNFPESKIVLLNSEGKQIRIPAVDGPKQDNASFFNNKLLYVEEPYGMSSASSMMLKMADLSDLQPYLIGNYLVEAYVGKSLLLSQNDSYSIFDTDTKEMKKIPESAFNKFYGKYWVSNMGGEIYFFTREKGGGTKATIGDMDKKDVKLYQFDLQTFQSGEILDIGPQPEDFFNGISDGNLYVGLYDGQNETYDFIRYQLGSPQTREYLFSIPYNKYGDSMKNFEVSDRFIIFTLQSGSAGEGNNKLLAYDMKSQKLYNLLANSTLEFSSDGNFVMEVNAFHQNHISGNEIVFAAYPNVNRNRKSGYERYNDIEIFKLTFP